jgi:DNA-directed RNA polymerase subunit M/transcription elongation factor TFIIS
MHFCQKCENMLYIRLIKENDNDLEYYCRSCGESDKLITKENICVSTTEIISQEKAYIHDINKYTKNDPTLPRTKIIKCPNQACASNSDAEKEVIYLRYDDKNLKYIYLCNLCNTIWKTSEQ